jgi:hypothetical protein
VKRGKNAVMSDHGWMKIPKLKRRKKILKSPIAGADESKTFPEEVGKK